MNIRGEIRRKRGELSRHLVGLIALENERKVVQISRSLTKIALSLMNLNRGSESLPINSANIL